jgi:hypothetical protein
MYAWRCIRALPLVRALAGSTAAAAAAAAAMHCYSCKRARCCCRHAPLLLLQACTAAATGAHHCCCYRHAPCPAAVATGVHCCSCSMCTAAAAAHCSHLWVVYLNDTRGRCGWSSHSDAHHSLLRLQESVRSHALQSAAAAERGQRWRVERGGAGMDVCLEPAGGHCLVKNSILDKGCNAEATEPDNHSGESRRGATTAAQRWRHQGQALL